MAYSPLPVPVIADDTLSLSQLRNYLSNEFRKISMDLKRLELLELNAAPDKPYHGQRVIADGTNWDPGSGRGVYWYDESGTSWNFLG